MWTLSVNAWLPTLNCQRNISKMSLSEFVDERMAAALSRTLPGVALEPRVRTDSGYGPSVSVALPVPPEAEYRFVLTLGPERQIHATLVSSPESKLKEYFWYRPFEDAEFKDRMEKLDAAFIDTIEKLVFHETRIVQKRGLLNHSFRLDYRSPRGWERVYSHWALRLAGISVPAIKGTQRIYHSPALFRRG